MDDRRGHEPQEENTVFAPARVATRGRPLVLVAGVLLAVGGLIGAGALGGADDAASPGAVADAPGAVADDPGASARTDLAVATHSPRRVPGLPRPGDDVAQLAGSPVAEVPLLTSGPGPIQLQARRNSASMFVHGDVFVPRVTWVYLSLRDSAGGVVSWASVSVPGAAGPGHGSGPTLRFDVEVAVPPVFTGALWVNANAYDADGELIATIRLRADPLGGVPPSS
jgi:hypothetical protein